MATQEPSLNQIATKLKKQTELTNQEIRDAAQKTIEEYQPLITDKKPALILYAQQKHNLQLMEKNQDYSLDIENIVPDMDNLNLKAKVTHITDTTNGDDWKRRKIKIKDQTDQTTITLWNENTEKLDKLNTGDKILIENTYTKYSDYIDGPEIKFHDGSHIYRLNEKEEKEKQIL